MKKNLSSSTPNAGYSIIAAVLMIGFLLVLTASTLNLVLQEMQDGKGRQNYIKAYAGAEGAMELALLKIKTKGYGFYEEVNDSDILGVPHRDGALSYDIDSETSSHSGTLAAAGSTSGNTVDIIPLFTIDSAGNPVGGITVIDFDEKLSSSDIVWNIIGPNGGISGKLYFNNLNPAGKRILSGADFEYDDSGTVGSMLQISDENYLIIQNFVSTERKYSLDTNVSFSKPRAVIKSSSKVGKYSQNLDTTVDNTEFLGILKYSVYSGN